MAIENTSANISFWADRLKASGIHLGVSLIVAALAALLVFGIWYPYPYREISGDRDLMVVALLQLSALGYGLWTVFVARPVHMVFEYDRFRVVHAIDVAPELLARTPPGILKIAQPVSRLKARFANRASEIDRLLVGAGPGAQSLVYVPMIGRKTFWTVLLDPASAEVRA